MEPIIGILVVLALSAVSSWLQKKQQGDDASPGNRDLRDPRRPVSRTGPQPPARSGWEEQLRRMLEGELGLPPASSPPVIRPTPPRPAPAPTPPPVALEVDQGEGEDNVEIKLSQAGQAYHKAQHLQEEAARRLQTAVEQTKTHRRVLNTRNAGRSADIAGAVSMIKNPKTVRQAIITSLILAPPKSLE